MSKYFKNGSKSDRRHNNESAVSAADLRTDKSIAKLLKISNDESWCYGCHDPILEPQDQFEYSLAFVCALLAHASPGACYLMIRGLNDAAKFISNEDEDVMDLQVLSIGRDVAPGAPPSKKASPESVMSKEKFEVLLQKMVEKYKVWKEEERRFDARCVAEITWRTLLRFAQPQAIRRRLAKAGVKLQITGGANEYRAAAATKVGTFDTNGETPEETLIKTLLLVQLATAQPIFDFPPE